MRRLKQELQRELIDPINGINTELVVVAATNERMSFNKLIKYLNNMNYYVNYNLKDPITGIKNNKKFIVQPHRRVMMTCFQQSGDKKHLTHSHILLRIPLNYNQDEVLELMHEGFNKLDPMFKVHKETANDTIANVIYNSSQFNDKYTPEDGSFIIM